LSTKAEQADVYAALLEVSHQLGASPDMNSVFRVTGETCLRMTGVDRCGIFMWNETERQFIPSWISSSQPEDIQQFLSLKLKYGDMALINKIVNEKRSVWSTREDGTDQSSLVRLFGIRSVLVIPLVSRKSDRRNDARPRGRVTPFPVREQAIIAEWQRRLPYD
jgi:GAF domain-containing protein